MPEIPNPNPQIPNNDSKEQIQNPKNRKRLVTFGRLGTWVFLGIWDLVLGISLGRDGYPAALSLRNRAGVRFPKIAVPTRTSVAPSSIATGKSSLIPMESFGNWTWNWAAN